MKQKDMYLFVWTDVLHYYTAGLAFAVAPDMETALQALSEKAGCDLDLPISKMTKHSLKDITVPIAHYVSGGG